MGLDVDLVLGLGLALGLDVDLALGLGLALGLDALLETRRNKQ